MRTIETIATVNPEGKLTIELASDLPPGTHQVVIVIDEKLTAQTEQATEEPGGQPEILKNAWTVLRAQAGSIEMPEDWSKEHDHYLYGTPKREP
ncbi:hypothetical protein [Leptolyngbya sp. 7M]|uniref:hypothetical protein n=1 Tax=Leptolyngbya sp. 7M TaxID=2812896 RepID=UPI001B8AB723|nr:hypothetical protein [Leptolyngbya sp. 7M]QYO67463.1 hypothetical protein JVX88_12105 [Leptolyngbya sp. 7M]